MHTQRPPRTHTHTSPSAAGAAVRSGPMCIQPRTRWWASLYPAGFLNATAPVVPPASRLLLHPPPTHVYNSRHSCGSTPASLRGHPAP